METKKKNCLRRQKSWSKSAYVDVWKGNVFGVGAASSITDQARRLLNHVAAFKYQRVEIEKSPNVTDWVILIDVILHHWGDWGLKPYTSA